MSYQVVQAVLAQAEPKKASRMVLVVLAECTNAKGVCWPSMRTIAARASISVRHAKHVIHALRQAGHIEIQPGHGRTHTNKYRILLKGDPQITLSSPEKVIPRSPFRADSQTQQTQEKVICATIKGDPQITRTVIEPVEPVTKGTHSPSSLGCAEGVCEFGNNGTPDTSVNPVTAGTVRRKPAPIESCSAKAATREAPPARTRRAREKSAAAPRAGDAGFAEFWTVYPRKVGKLDAKRAWAKLKPPLGKVLAAVEAWQNSAAWLKEEGRFIPHPATWLNRGGWEDELPAVRQQPESFI